MGIIQEGNQPRKSKNVEVDTSSITNEDKLDYKVATSLCIVLFVISSSLGLWYSQVT